MSKRLELRLERHGGTGLIAAHADELPGLNVFGRSFDEVRERLPRSIEAMMRATCNKEVRVLGVEIDSKMGSLAQQPLYYARVVIG